MADSENSVETRQKQLFSLYRSESNKFIADSSADSLDELLDTAIKILESSPVERGEIAPVAIHEILRLQSEDAAFSKVTSDIGVGRFYEGYTRFLLSLRNRLLDDHIVDSGILKIKTVASPDLAAYKPTGFNELSIKPELSSYARVF